MAKPKTRILALVNHKGGVGKTTTAVNLAAIFAREGPTLLMDCDGQGSASISLGFEPHHEAQGTAEVLLEGFPLGAAVRATDVPGLDIVLGTRNLLLADLRLASLTKRARRLADALGPVAPGYRTIILDLPPSLGLVALNGLVAADGYLVPLSPRYLDARGISSLTWTVAELAGFPMVSRTAQCLGYVLTIVDRRPNRGIAEITQQLRDAKGAAVFDTIIPMSAGVANAPSHGVPVVLHDPENAGAVAYLQLHQELVRRMDA